MFLNLSGISQVKLSKYFMFCVVLLLLEIIVNCCCFFLVLYVDLYTGSKDKSLQAVDMNSGAVAHSIVKAHK